MYFLNFDYFYGKAINYEIHRIKRERDVNTQICESKSGITLYYFFEERENTELPKRIETLLTKDSRGAKLNSIIGKLLD